MITKQTRLTEEGDEIPRKKIMTKLKMVFTDAKFSSCERYRYTLTRTWDMSKAACAFIGLNPSTADQVENDPTVRRCIYFANEWGYGTLIMLNAYAIRGTDPNVIKVVEDPIGPDNDYWIEKTSKEVAIIIGAWGNNIKNGNKDRSMKIRELVPNLHVLAMTKLGQPAHPLYLKKSLVPIPFP